MEAADAVIFASPVHCFNVSTLMKNMIDLFVYQMHSAAGWQVLADLVVALVLVLSWLIPDARRHGRNPWPWVIATPLVGSVAPLLYLALGRGEGPA